MSEAQNVYTEQDLLEKDRKELFSIAESFQLKHPSNVPTIKLVQSILDAQADSLEESEQEETEVKEETSTKEDKVSPQEELEVEDKEDPSGFDKSVETARSTVNLDANQLIQAIQSISLNQSSNHVKVRPNRTFETDAGKEAYRKLKRDSQLMVLIRLNKNNNRMRGERFVAFDFGNDVYDLQWSVRLGHPWYVPRTLIPHIKSRAYQRIDTTDDLVATQLGSGHAETKANFTPALAREYSLEILEDTGKTAAQLMDELALKRKMGKGFELPHSDDFDGITL